MLGPKWADAATIFRYLTPTILVFGIIDPTYQYMVSIGKQVRSLHIAFVIAPLVIVSYLIGLPYGPKGVALAYSIAMTLWVVPHVFWCVHGTTISPRELFFTLWRPFAAGVLAAALTLVLQASMGEINLVVLRLLVEGGVMSIAYAAILVFVFGQKQLYIDLLRTLFPARATSFARMRALVGEAENWVEVRSKEEILRTLDKNGRLEGMPFMPQMFEHCGKRLQVYKRAHKTCDTVGEMPAEQVGARLKHAPEKVAVFGKDHAEINKLERGTTPKSSRSRVC